MKKSKYTAAVLLLTASAVICSAAGFYSLIRQNFEEDPYQKIREEVRDTLQIPEEEEECGQETEQIPVDFEKLQEMNPDVYAWMAIPGTAIDYPVVQHENDNAYYLTHAADNTECAEGSIYTEKYNRKDFEDINTVIYGHNMRNGSMFRDLLKYKDRSYFDTHKDIVIYTPDAELRYTVFAAYTYDDRHLLRSFDFSEPEVAENYLERILNIREMDACVDTEAALHADDRILTLSTCNGNNRERYLVQAVLVSEEEKQEGAES